MERWCEVEEKRLVVGLGVSGFVIFIVPILLLFGFTKFLYSDWEEELPCGTSSQGTIISSDNDGSWSDWTECSLD